MDILLAVNNYFHVIFLNININYAHRDKLIHKDSFAQKTSVVHALGHDVKNHNITMANVVFIPTQSNFYTLIIKFYCASIIYRKII